MEENRKPVFGRAVVPQDVKPLAQSLLAEGESVLGVFDGQPMKREGGGPMARRSLGGYLFVTDRRVVFWAKGIFSSGSDAFLYRDIASVEGVNGFMFGELVLNIRGTKERFRRMTNDDVPVAVQLIRHQIDLEMQGKTMAPQESPMEQLKQLGELYKAGIVTAEEFESKKAELLSRI